MKYDPEAIKVAYYMIAVSSLLFGIGFGTGLALMLAQLAVKP